MFKYMDDRTKRSIPEQERLMLQDETVSCDYDRFAESRKGLMYHGDSDIHRLYDLDGTPPIMYSPNDVRQFVLPVFKFYAFGNFHTILGEANWDFKSLYEQHKNKILRSEREISNLTRKRHSTDWDAVLLRWDHDTFLLCRHNCRVFAPTIEKADQVLHELVEKYGKKRQRKKKTPSFHILNVQTMDIDTEEVEIKRKFIHSPEDLSLHYGDDFVDWEKDFIKRLTSTSTGVSLFQGVPGTGKTSYIRHLISKLCNRCRFYYLPTTQYHLITQASMVGFWRGQNKRYDKQAKIIILEDAEQILMKRENDNRDEVSNLLNLSDGLLGEFFNMHLICTINCKVDDLDAAVLREGRMVTYREFPRLTRGQAQRLANKFGRTLPERDDYSLAEIYSVGNNGAQKTERKTIGFMA